MYPGALMTSSAEGGAVTGGASTATTSTAPTASSGAGMYAAAGIVAASLVTSYLGNKASKKQMAAAEAAMKAAQDEIRRVGAPPDLSREIIFDKFQSAGLMTPELENVIDMSISEASKQYRGMQEQALRQMDPITRMGMRAEDFAALQKMQTAEKARVAGEQAAMQREFQQRGQAGAGGELASRLSSLQGSRAIGSQNVLDLAGQSAQRGLQAIQQRAALAQQMEQNQNALDQFNVANARTVQQHNVAAKNLAQQQNLERQQAIMSANTQQANAEKLRQVQAKRDFWQDRLAQASAMAGTYAPQQNLAMQRANTAGQSWANIGSALGQGIGAVANRADAADQRDFEAKQRQLDREAYKTKPA